MIDWISIVRTSRRRFSTLHVRSPVRIRSRPRKQKSSSSSSSTVGGSAGGSGGQLPATSSSSQLCEDANNRVMANDCNICMSNRRKADKRSKQKQDPANAYCTSPHCPFVSRYTYSDHQYIFFS